MFNFSAETPEDIPQIRAILVNAFGQPNEAELVDAIRNSPNFISELSLVAKEGGNLLAHVLFTPIIIEAQNQQFPALALAPLAVTPARQRQGIGSQLVQVGLSKCRQLGHSIVIVLGHPEYYSRFGFQTASKFGIKAPFPVPDAAFMVLELKPGALKNVSGIVRYPQYFDRV